MVTGVVTGVARCGCKDTPLQNQHTDLHRDRHTDTNTPRGTYSHFRLRLQDIRGFANTSTTGHLEARKLHAAIHTPASPTSSPPSDASPLFLPSPAAFPRPSQTSRAPSKHPLQSFPSHTASNAKLFSHPESTATFAPPEPASLASPTKYHHTVSGILPAPTNGLPSSKRSPH